MIVPGALLGSRQNDTPILLTEDARLCAGQLLDLRPAGGQAGRVAVCVRSQENLVRALVAYDGRCEALFLLSDSLSPDDVQSLLDRAAISLLVSDRDDLAGAVHPDAAITTGEGAALGAMESSWMLATSGTTGQPKIVCHTLASLTRTVRAGREGQAPAIWGLTYDPCRFAGLQVVLQALCGGGTLVASHGHGSVKAQLDFFHRSGVTHISATPTRWRQYLMHPEAGALPLKQITLGGEIADQRLLDMLRARYPAANITHVYASTETGVGFSVQDGVEGFPAAWLDQPPGAFRLKLADDMLWVKSGSSATGYLERTLEQDADGFVNTQDRVEERDGRVTFLGRATGEVNVGGAKVHPEMVERRLNAHDGVVMSRVAGRKNPFSGSILFAEVVPTVWPEDEKALKSALIDHCRAGLAAEAVPAVIKIVRELGVGATGKLERTTG